MGITRANNNKLVSLLCKYSSFFIKGRYGTLRFFGVVKLSSNIREFCTEWTPLSHYITFYVSGSRRYAEGKNVDVIGIQHYKHPTFREVNKCHILVILRARSQLEFDVTNLQCI